jgi:hypothetical protein
MGWKSKFILLLIVYFAGFATAVYNLAPASETGKEIKSTVPANQDKKSFAMSDVKTDEFIKTLNEQMHKCMAVGKDAALKAGKFMKQKYDERQQAKNTK